MNLRANPWTPRAKRPCLWAALVWAGLLLLLLCPGPLAAQEPQPALLYVVHSDEALGRLHVRIEFTSLNPRRLVLENEQVLSCLAIEPSSPTQATLRPHAEGGLEPTGLSRTARYVAYSVDIERLLTLNNRSREVSRVGRDLLVRPGLVLLRPVLWPLEMSAHLRFVLPPGQEAAVPWPCLDRAQRVFRLDSQALRLDARVALGRFALRDLRVEQSRFRIAVLDEPHAFSQEGLTRWVTEAGRAVSTLYGRFSQPEVLLLVRPVAARRPAVLFGQASRAGGEMVQALVAAAASDEELPGEWVLVHELLHLGTPWTPPQDAWFQEGFVTWYQEVLRARAGLIGVEDAWGNLLDGFRRGSSSGTGRTLGEESRHMSATHSYWRVYWAGAALALTLDVHYRRQSQGRLSLDDAMRLWLRRHGTLVEPLTGLDLLREAESALGLAGGAAAVEAALGESEFPEVQRLLAWLGVSPQGATQVRLVQAPGNLVRDAIMAPSPPRHELDTNR